MDELPRITRGFLEALAEVGVVHALAGGLSANVWLPPERQFPTEDVDVAVLPSQKHPIHVHRLAELIAERTGRGCIHSADLDFGRTTILRWVCFPGDTIADAVIADRVYAKAALARRRGMRLGDMEFPVLAPEDVILYKSLGKRPKDFGPIESISDTYSLDMVYLERWARHLGVLTFLRRALRISGR